VLTARFFIFRPFLEAGGLGRLGSCKPRPSRGFSIGVNREASMAKFMAVGDCGEGPGDGSVTEAESKEAEVVGEDSTESEADVDVECLA
jgi:hypothetical protein